MDDRFAVHFCCLYAFFVLICAIPHLICKGLSCISCKGFIFLSWIHVQFYIKFTWFVELNVLGSFVLFLFFFVILWTKVDAKEQNEQVFNIDTMTQSKNTIFMLFSNLFLFSLTLLFSQKPYSAPLLICKFAPSLIRFQHLHKSKRKKWGNGTIRRICLHIVCYSYYVRTLLKIRCEKHYSY